VTTQNGPLHGITVLDLTSYIFGPYATQTLGDLGANVIKIEPPDGDRMRVSGRRARSQDLGLGFMSVNRNKRSVVLDLKDEADHKKFLAMIPKAQVLIHNMRSAATIELGFSYEAIASLNPSMIYVHCVGYGSGGAYAGRQAFDDLVQAASGAADLLRRVDDSPEMRILPSFVADKVSGLHALYATLAALFHRERTGEGQSVEVPMLECVTHFTMIEHLYGATLEPPAGSVGNSVILNPNRAALKTKDGHIAVQLVGKREAARFLELGGVPGFYESDAFRQATDSNARVEVFHAAVRTAARSHTTAEWMRLGDEHRIPVMRANRLEEVLDDPHLQSVDFFQLREHPTEGQWRTMKPPVSFARTPCSIRHEPPHLGENGVEIEAETLRSLSQITGSARS
jgi:crotonobetainyl-CoA:carnitine CoA-transferase CaiB-like acyl-CoA transferase